MRGVLARSQNAYLHREVCGCLCRKNVRLDKIKKETTADVRVRVRNRVVVDVEHTIVGVLVIVTANVEARVRRVEVPVIARGLRTKTPAMHRQSQKVQRLTAQLSEWAAAPSDSPVGEFLETTTDVRVRVRNRVAVDAEHTKVGVLDIATANAEARVRRAEVPVIARVGLGAAVCGSRDKERIPAGRLDRKSGRITVRRDAHRRAAAAVAEVCGVQDDVEAIAVVVAAIAPVITIIPQSLDVAVLRPAAVGGAAALGRAGVVGHRVGIPHRLRGAVVSAAVPDGFLTVPVAKFDDIEQPDSKPHCEIALPDRRAEIVDAGAGRRAGDIRLGAAGAAFIAAVAVVSADVHHIPLAVTVASVHVDRTDAVALHRVIGNLNGHASAVLLQLVPEFGNSHHSAAGALTLCHTRPWL